MSRHLRDRAGLGAIDLMLAIVLVSIAAALIAHGLRSTPEVQQEQLLRSRLEMVRSAISAYQYDHGFYPGSSQDWGYPLSDAQLREKLSSFTDHKGVPSPTPSHRFKYGPYLATMPAEPYSNSASLQWALQERRPLAELVGEVTGSQAEGGWYYAPESGSVLANLGREYPQHLAGF